jgi:PleD family two-component response regulator
MQQPLSLLICDVDHFKLYNDGQSHQAGDDCLKSSQSNKPVAKRVCEAVATANLPHAMSPVCDRVTVSIGVVCITPEPYGPADARKPVEEADRHLYLAKQLGRNRVSYQDMEDNTQCQ